MSSDTSQRKEIILRDSQAPEYENSFLRTRGPFGYRSQIGTVLFHLSPSEDDYILDAGCGIGIYSLQISKKAKEVCSVDFSQKSIDELNKVVTREKISNIKTVVSDLSKVSLPYNHFDKAIAVEVIQHVPTYNKKIEIMKNIYDSLKEDGKMVFVVYRYGGWIKAPRLKEESDHRGTGLYRMAFTPDDCEKIFFHVGFKIEYIGGVLNIHKKIRKRLRPSLSFIEVFISRLSISKHLGDYLLIVGRK